MERRRRPDPDRDILLERLCFYRGVYGQRGTADRGSTMSVEAAVRYGEGMLRIARRRAEFQARRGPHDAAANR